MWQKIEQVVAANLWDPNGKKCLSPALDALASPIPRLNLGQMQELDDSSKESKATFSTSCLTRLARHKECRKIHRNAGLAA